MNKTEKWCRIISLPDGNDVLITKEFDEEEEAPKLNATCQIDGVRCTLGMGFKTDEQLENAFETFTVETAQNLINQTREMMG